MPHLQCTAGLSTSAVFAWGKILPEERVVDVSTTMEIDQWLKGDLCGDVFLGLGSLELLGSCVEAVDICLVVILVVEFHDLAGDGGLKCAKVVYKSPISF